MKKILFIYFRPDYLEISNYPFFHRLIEELHPSFEISLLDMSDSDIGSLSYGIKEHFKLKNKQFVKRGFRRYNKKLFAYLCIQKINNRKYDHVVVIGGNAIDIIPELKYKTSANVFYIDDEFPWLFRKDMEVVSHCLKKADVIISLDKVREQVLCERLNLSPVKTHVIANIPADRQLNSQQIDWVTRLNLNPGKKYVLFHGSLGQLCQLPEIMCTVPLWDDAYDLIILGWREKYEEIYKHLRHPKIITVEGRLQDDEYNSLIRFSYASLGLYSEFADLEFIGTSSGKILRSLLLGTPVIANHYASNAYITGLGAGAQISSVLEIPALLKDPAFREKHMDMTQNPFSIQYKGLHELMRNFSPNLSNNRS